MNAIEKLAKMAKENNPTIKLAPLSNISSTVMGKTGVVTVTIKLSDPDFLKKLAGGELVGGLLYADKVEFDKQ